MRRPGTRVLSSLLLVILPLPLLTFPGWADTYTVGPSGRDFTHIQPAIDSAVSGDTLLVDPASYVETLVIAGKALTLATSDPGGSPIVRLPPDSTRAVLELRGAASDTMTLIDGLTFRGGKGWLDTAAGATFGGAVVIRDAAHLRLRHATADSSTADWGGGIAVVGAGQLVLESSSIDSCRALLGGGGLHLGTTDTVLVDSLVVTRSECASGDGGGVLAAGSGPITLSNLDVRGNRAARGAGLAIASGSQVTLRRTLVVANTATAEGGGLHLSASADLDFLTIDSNTAPADMGGGILVAAGSPSIRNSIVSRNRGGIVCSGGAAALDYNDIWGKPPNLSGCQPGSGDISADPRFAGGDPFDYHLTSRSPAIDAADPTEPVPLDGGARADIGAFEFRSGPQFVAFESNDPDLVYKNGDTVDFDIEWEADPTLTVAIEPDFSGLDSDTTVPPAVTAIATGDPRRFRFAVTKRISAQNEVGDSSGILVPVTATSSLGGSTTVQAFAATLDNTSPPIPLLAPLPATAIAPDLLVSGTARESDGAAADSVSVRVNGAHRAGIRPNGSGAFSAGVTLSERSNAITAVALDRAGNPSPATPAQTVAFVPDFFIEVPKRFHPGDAFTVGSPSADMAVEVRIVNLAGQLINTLTGGGSELLTLVWEGRNADEEAVNAGPYIARITVDIPGQPRRLEHRALILVSR